MKFIHLLLFEIIFKMNIFVVIMKMEQFQQKIIQKNVNNMNKNMEQNKERTKYELCPLRTYSI